MMSNFHKVVTWLDGTGRFAFVILVEREWREVVAPIVARPPEAKTTATETYRASLRKNLVECFNDSELHDLCFDMDVDYESLKDEGRSDKARELVAYCERRQIIPVLVAKCKELRPKVSWEGEYE